MTWVRQRVTLAVVVTNAFDIRVRTVCHYCHGDGAVAFPRAVCLSDVGDARAYDVRPCSMCQGREWLPGTVAPL